MREQRTREAETGLEPQASPGEGSTVLPLGARVISTVRLSSTTTDEVCGRLMLSEGRKGLVLAFFFRLRGIQEQPGWRRSSAFSKCTCTEDPCHAGGCLLWPT